MHSFPFQYQIEGGTRVIEVKMAVEAGVLDQRSLSVWPGERRDWLGGGPT